MNFFPDENFNDDETILDELIHSLISSNSENEKCNRNNNNSINNNNEKNSQLNNYQAKNNNIDHNNLKNRNIKNQNKQFDSQNCLQNKIVYEIIMDCSEDSDYIIYYRK